MLTREMEKRSRAVRTSPAAVSPGLRERPQKASVTPGLTEQAMSNRWKIAVAAILLLCAGVTAHAAGAQSEPKQKGAEKGEPAASQTNTEVCPNPAYQSPGASKGLTSGPPVPEKERDR
jgi:hypothetical protein